MPNFKARQNIMEINGNIYRDTSYNNLSFICEFILKEFPAACNIFHMDFNTPHYLNNLLKIDTHGHWPNGEFYVQRSLINVDYSEIELRLARYKGTDPINSICFFKGKYFASNTSFTVNLLFNEKFLKQLRLSFTPKSNQDYLLIDGMVYEPNIVYYNGDGSVTIDLINEVTKEQFRRNGLIGLI